MLLNHGVKLNMAKIVVFDLDGTLISNDSTKVWITQSLMANPLRLCIALLIMPVAMLFMKIKKYKIIGSSLFLWVATFGLNQVQLHRQLKQFSQNINQNKFKTLHWFKDGLAELKTQIKTADQVIIITAAPEILAQTLLHSLNIDATIMGTPLKRTFGGWVGYAHCRHTEKLRRLQSFGINQPWHASYSDDIQEDYPILSHCQYAYLINAHSAQPIQHQLNIKHLTWS